jgi:hypothetical protein
MKQTSRVVLLVLGVGLLAVVWWSLSSHVNTASAQIGYLGGMPNPQNFRIYTFPDLTSTTLGGNWTVMNGAGKTAVVSNLAGFRALTFTAFNNGHFDSGQSVTLTFVNGSSTPNPFIEQIFSKVVDQLDGDLYMSGSFGSPGFSGGAKGYVAVAPTVTPVETPPLAANQAITLTLSGYCTVYPESACPGVQ